ncbi:hypothetical protein GCM10029992_20780 [Glycomyces albus]
MAALAAGGGEEEQSEREGHAVGEFARAVEDFGEVEASHGADHDEHGQQEADVGDAVGQEGLLAGGGGGGFGLPEGDEEVGGEADPFPADEGHEVVAAEDEDEHGGDEEVEVGEESAPAFVVRHVADGVDVDEEADAGDQEREDAAERVEQEAGLDVEFADRDEGEQVGGGGLVLEAGQAAEHGQGEREGAADGGDAEPVPPFVGSAAGQEQYGGSGGGQGYEQPGPGEQPGGGRVGHFVH